jgi:hypothetical protein
MSVGNALLFLEDKFGGCQESKCVEGPMSQSAEEEEGFDRPSLRSQGLSSNDPFARQPGRQRPSESIRCVFVCLKLCLKKKTWKVIHIDQ